MEKNTTLPNFVLFLWRRHFKNSCLGFHQVSKREKTFETTRPAISHTKCDCDLLAQDYNIFDGDRSTVSGCFDIGGEPFERVNYTDPGEITDFKGVPLKFE